MHARHGMCHLLTCTRLAGTPQVEGMDTDQRMVESRVVRNVRRGAANPQPRADVIMECAVEVEEIKAALRLDVLDDELHRAYASTEEFFKTTVLHGYEQMQYRPDVIVAIQREITSVRAGGCVHACVCVYVCVCVCASLCACL